MVGLFKKRACLFCFTAYLLIFIYYIHLLLYYQTRANGLVVDALAGNHWDLGSNPRSTQNSFISFLNMFMCRIPKAFHHMPPIIQAPCGCQHRSNGPKLDDHHTPGQCTCRQLPKSNRLERQMGHNFQTSLLNGPAPPGFFILFSFTF